MAGLIVGVAAVTIALPESILISGSMLMLSPAGRVMPSILLASPAIIADTAVGHRDVNQVETFNVSPFQIRPGQIDIDQLRSSQDSIAQIGVTQVEIDQIPFGQISTRRINPLQIATQSGSVQDSILHIDSSQISPIQGGRGEISPLQLGMTEVRPTEVNFLHNSPSQIGETQIGIQHRTTSEESPSQIGSLEINIFQKPSVSEVSVSKITTAEVNPLQGSLRRGIINFKPSAWNQNLDVGELSDSAGILLQQFIGRHFPTHTSPPEENRPVE
ncbi:MAG: hypothetical protein AAGD09_21460 [Cyanobacteria bacterium P01_F01_bin.56]